MHSPATSKQRPPYGLSFAIDDLVAVRSWANVRRMVMTVALDQTMDGAEFEEMLVISAEDRRKRYLTLWRTFGTVFVQTQGGRPRGFVTIAEALDAIRPAGAKRASGWFNFLRS